LEFSLAGNLTSRLHVVSGLAFIEPQVRFLPGAVAGPTHAVAVGPIPGYMNTSLEYHPAAVQGLILGATVSTTSSRYAEYPAVNLPAVTIVGADVRYHFRLARHPATLLLQGYNLTDAHRLLPSASGELSAYEARRYEMSLEIDL
jgi:hypothetical protein